MSSLPTAIAETIQDGHIEKHPDPRYDLAPATAADAKVPVSLHGKEYAAAADLDDDDEDDEIPVSVLRPVPRKTSLPPLPDLRFEQSYLHSIAGADTWWKILLITMRDQVGS